MTPDDSNETEPESESLAATELVEKAQSAESSVESIEGTMTTTSTDVTNISLTSIRWTNDDLTYTVSGTADAETLRTVAESIIE